MQKGIEKNINVLEPRLIQIYDRKKIDVVGIKEVVSSTEKEVYVKLLDGVMKIVGSGLTIQKLVPEEEILVISGQIDGVSFQTKMTKRSILGRVFK